MSQTLSSSGVSQSPRDRLNQARLMLIFTPELCAEPKAALRAAWEHVDIVQVRPKPVAGAGPSQRPTLELSDARSCLEWGRFALRLRRERPERAPLLIINDRVDVTKVLLAEGIDGVHLGQDDTPPEVARDFLGPDALIGLSTHNYDEVKRAELKPVDYLGFGAVFSTSTKAVTAQNHCVQSWVASTHGTRPVFAIGGIRADNAWMLAPIGRVAVGSGILNQPDPAAAAQAIRAALRPRGPQARRRPGR